MQNTKNFQKGRRRKVPPPNTFFEKRINIAPTASPFPYPRRLLHPALQRRKNIYLGIEFPIRCGEIQCRLVSAPEGEKRRGGGCIGYQSSSHFYVSERPVFLGGKRGCDCLFFLPPPSFESGYRKEEIFSFQVRRRRTTTPICHIYSFTPEKEKPPKPFAKPIKHRVFYYDFWRHLVNSMSGQEGNGRKIPSPPVSSPLSFLTLI